MTKVYNIFMISIIIMINVTYYMMMATLSPYLYAENGSMENMQALILFVAMLLFLYGAYKVQIYKIFFYIAALLQFSFVLRELDVEEMVLPYWVIAISGEEGRLIVLPILWLIVVFIYFKHFALNKIRSKYLLISKIGILTGVSLLFLILSDLAEKSIFPLEPHQFWEELFELDGYMMLFFVALLLPSCVRGQSTGR